MGWVEAFWLFVVSTAIQIAFQKTPQDVSKASDGEFQVPTAEEGRVIPVAFGTCYFKAPNVVWWGNLAADPMKTKTGGFLGLGAKTYTTGWKYYVSLVMAICHGPIDALVDVVIGEKSCAALPMSIGSDEGIIPTLPLAPGAPLGRDIYIGARNMFGGELREGGLRGVLSFYFGDDAQTVDNIVNEAWGGNGPAWRGIAYCVWKGHSDPSGNPVRPGGYVGTSPYLKDMAFVVRRCPTPAGFDPAKANINGDANPAHMIYEILTDPTWGLGITPARFDLPTWTAAAATLYAEGFGMSLQLDSETTADAAIADILRTIDGVVYTDPATGLWTLKLARLDYDPATLPEFTCKDLLQAPEWSRGQWSETANEVRVEFVDRAQAFTRRIVQVQETANLATQGMTSAVTLPFHGVSNPTVANKIAMRELKTLSYPLAKFRLKVNRKAWALRPGSVFKLTWDPPTGVVFSGMVLRATSIRYGALEAGEIEIEAVEDIFSVASTAFPGPGSSGWSDPAAAPVPVVASRLWEAPYHLVGPERWVLAAAARGDLLSFSAEIWTNEGLGYVRGADLDSFTPSALLAASYSARTSALDLTGFTLAAPGVDLARLVESNTDANGRARGDNLAVFEDTGEIVSWTTAIKNPDGTYTLAGILRGVLDTVPADHPDGTRVWFLSEGVATTRDTPYASDLTVKAKLLPKNPRGTVALADATEIQTTTTSRALAPYPPGNVQVNSLGYGSWPSKILGDATYAWSHRNRLTQGIGGAMVAQDTAGAYALEGNYTLEVLVGGALKRTFTGETGSGKAYTAAMRLADDADGTKAVQLRITPINGGLAGTPRTTPGVVMTGLGMTLGQNLGGIQA